MNKIKKGEFMINKSINIVRKRRSLFILIFVVTLILSTSIVLSGCGSGGGGGNNSNANVSTTPLPSIIKPLPPIIKPISNTMNVYLEQLNGQPSTNHIYNRPYVNVYINGSSTPIHLLLDTGATGILINQSALTSAGINITPTTFTFSGQFGDSATFSGDVAYANISTSGGLTAQNMPIAVATNDEDFPSTGFLQGDFGMGLSPYYSFGGAVNTQGELFTPSFATAISNSSYNNGFILDFNNLLFTNGYDIIANPQTTPVGTIIYGLNTTVNNTIPSGSIFYANNPLNITQSFPLISAEFGGYIEDSQGQMFYITFDTGTSFIHLGSDALNYGIASGATINDVDSSCLDEVFGGFNLYYGLYTATEWTYNSFITEPVGVYDDFCEYSALTSASTSSAGALDNAVIYDQNITEKSPGQEIFGLPFMFNQPMYWQAQTSNSTWGVGIES